MRYHSKRKVGAFKEGLINILYGVGVKPDKMPKWFNVSRATIYRHIIREQHRGGDYSQHYTPLSLPLNLGVRMIKKGGSEQKMRTKLSLKKSESQKKELKKRQLAILKDRQKRLREFNSWFK